MRAKNTIVINGKVYDAVSGLPAGAPDPVAKSASQAHTTVSPSHRPAAVAAEPAPAPHRQTHAAKSVHRRTQHSQTLRRDVVKAPHQPQKLQVRRKPAPGSVQQSTMISRFAAHPQPLPKQPTPHTGMVDAVSRAPKAAAPVHHHVKSPALSSRELKEKLIAERLAAAQPAHHSHESKPKGGFFTRVPRVSTVLAASFAVIFLGGYLTYINMPNLSMHVAAAHAGVAASFPDYRPDGYRFDGPIAYNSGEVSVKFASNTNGSSYTVNQQNSGWDSQAVLDNYVSKKSKDYLTYSEQGLTIYTFDGKAAWVNGGVFYTIEGNAPLSNDQILRIAGSM